MFTEGRGEKEREMEKKKMEERKFWGEIKNVRKGHKMNGEKILSYNFSGAFTAI